MFDAEDVQKNKGLGIVMAIFPVLFFLPLVMNDKKDSAFLKYYVNTILGLFIVGTVITVCSRLGIPFLSVIAGIASIPYAVFDIMAIIYIAQGEGKKVPLFSEINIIK